MKTYCMRAGGSGRRDCSCRAGGIVLPVLLLLLAASPFDSFAETHGGGHGAMGSQGDVPGAGPFMATTEKSFPDLMGEAMAIMDRGMMAAPQNGDPDHDFITMMIPHHQGAIDMAKVLLLYGKDLELHNLALQIITDQQYEINLMRAWLARHGGDGPPDRKGTQPK